MYEYEASAARDKFNSEFEKYKKTDNYREYIKYLADFKSKLVSKDGKDSAGKNSPIPQSTQPYLMINEGIEEHCEVNTKRPKLENIPSGGSTGTASVSGTAGGSVSSIGSIGGSYSMAGGMGKSGTTVSGPTTTYHSSPTQKISSPPMQHHSGPPTSTGAPHSPSKATSYAIDFAGYRDALARTTQKQKQESQIQTKDVDTHFFPRIHSAVQSPHIQQQSSYLRHQPGTVGTLPQPIGRNTGVVLPSPGIRRRGDETFSPLSSVSGSLSSSGSSTVPSIPLTPSLSSLDDTTRSQRALPLPSPSSASGYFDQRTHHHRQTSQPQSPRSSYAQTPLPLPAMDHVSRTYSPSVAHHPTASSGISIPSGGLPPPPPTPRPPSHNRPT